MSLTNLDIQVAKWPADESLIKAIRRKVFVIEQGVEPEIEWDGKDPDCTHILAWQDNELIGTGRIQKNGHVGRLAVTASARGHGVGTAMLTALIQVAQKTHDMVYLNAQTHAIGFYEKFGFVADGQVFMVAGIPHQRMELHFNSEEQSGKTLKDNELIVGIEANYQATLDLCRQARRSIDIFSRDLDRRLLSRGTLIQELRKFIKISPNSRLRVLVADPSFAIRYDHRLIELSQDFSSYIELRQTHKEYYHLTYSYLLIDSAACLYRSNAEEYSATLHLEPSTTARRLDAEFNEIWNLSEPVTGIKRLFI